MNLDIKVVRQEKDSADCGLAVISMLLSYYGINRDISELKKEICVYKCGTYLPQLGRYLMENGFETEIITMNQRLFTNKFQTKSRDELSKYIGERYKFARPVEDNRSLLHFEKFMKEGGNIKVKIPSQEDIREEICNKRPLITSLTSAFLLDDEPGFNFHFNLVTGIGRELVYVNDPLWNSFGGKQKYSIDDFMYAIHSSAFYGFDKASIMKVRKK